MGIMHDHTTIYGYDASFVVCGVLMHCGSTCGNTPNPNRIPNCAHTPTSNPDQVLGSLPATASYDHMTMYGYEPGARVIACYVIGVFGAASLRHR